jgi:hypothetical protein
MIIWHLYVSCAVSLLSGIKFLARVVQYLEPTDEQRALRQQALLNVSLAIGEEVTFHSLKSDVVAQCDLQVCHLLQASRYMTSNVARHAELAALGDPNLAPYAFQTFSACPRIVSSPYDRIIHDGPGGAPHSYAVTAA